MTYTFDSRKVKKGDTFFALSGGMRDGNDFAESAFKNGAEMLILNREPNFEIPEQNYKIVPNVLDFITEMAKKKFAKMKKNGIKTVSLTGSSGKTTAKDFIIFLLEQSGKRVFGTEGNYNNHIGVPMTILNSPNEIEFLILEMGMNAVGEISHLVEIAQTDIRIITNISNAHTGNFKDGITGIKKAKLEILERSDEKTILIIPQTIKCDFVGRIAHLPRIINYKSGVDSTKFEIYGRIFTLQMIVTEEWLSSILFGFEVLRIFKIPLPDDILNFYKPSGRGEEIYLSEACKLIDESYNASPVSVINAIKTLNLHSGKKLLILGSMKELGKETYEEHKKVADFVLKMPDIHTIFVGDEFAFLRNSWFKTTEELIANFPKDDVLKYNVILVKGANSLNLVSFCRSLYR